jgi:hypothetical protein
MNYTYKDIEPLIVSREVEGTMIKLKFQAPNQNEPIDSMAVVTPSQEEIMAKVKKQTAKTMAVSAGAGVAGSVLGSMIGGVAGSAVSSGASMAGSAASSQMMNSDDLMAVDMTEEKMQEAIVNAFAGMSPYYSLNNGVWEFTAPSA